MLDTHDVWVYAGCDGNSNKFITYSSYRCIDYLQKFFLNPSQNIYLQNVPQNTIVNVYPFDHDYSLQHYTAKLNMGQVNPDYTLQRKCGKCPIPGKDGLKYSAGLWCLCEDAENNVSPMGFLMNHCRVYWNVKVRI